MHRHLLWPLLALLAVFCIFAGCEPVKKEYQQTKTVTDQLGRQVIVPAHPKKVAALRHFGGKIVYALGRQDLLVERSIYGMEAKVLARISPEFAALPEVNKSHGYNVEGLVSLNPEIVFVYSSTDMAQISQFEQAGIPVVAVKGETFEESFEAIRLMGNVLNCEKEAEMYIRTCRDLLSMVAQRLENRTGSPRRVLFAGPKSIYSAATGNMLQSRILELSGAVNVAAQLTGFWADISPEQIAVWDPEVIFLGSYLDQYGKEKIYKDSHFSTITAVKEKQIYAFPSNVGWWDYPAPHCVLGVAWAAKTLYPQLFLDIDMQVVADKFYTTTLGYSFSDLGGRLK